MIYSVALLPRTRVGLVPGSSATFVHFYCSLPLAMQPPLTWLDVFSHESVVATFFLTPTPTRTLCQHQHPQSFFSPLQVFPGAVTFCVCVHLADRHVASSINWQRVIAPSY